MAKLFSVRICRIAVAGLLFTAMGCGGGNSANFASPAFTLAPVAAGLTVPLGLEQPNDKQRPAVHRAAGWPREQASPLDPGRCLLAPTCAEASRPKVCRRILFQRRSTEMEAPCV